MRELYFYVVKQFAKSRTETEALKNKVIYHIFIALSKDMKNIQEKHRNQKLFFI